MEHIWTQLEKMGVIPVVAMADAADASKLGAALTEGGLPCVEITFRTAAAADAIRTLSATYPNMVIGAGTVLTVAQAQTAADAGAKFIVTPGFDHNVVDWCLENRIQIAPGVMTPTDINAALSRKLTVLKFFPAEAAGGIDTLHAISAPYSNVKFIPTGGINSNNLSDYLSLSAVLACGGSWLVKKTLISNGKFDTISDLVREAVQLVQQARSR